MKITGTIGGITFYKMNNIYYARKKTSLDKARVLSDPAFDRSRKSSALFGQASNIAKQLYRRLSPKQKGHRVIGTLTAKANKILHAGHSPQTALAHLVEEYLGPSATEQLQLAAINQGFAKHNSKISSQELLTHPSIHINPNHKKTNRSDYRLQNQDGSPPLEQLLN